MSHDEKHLEGSAPILIVIASAVSGTLRKNDEAFGARIGIPSKRDPLTGAPVFGPRDVGLFEPTHLRMLDRQRGAPIDDVRIGIQLWNDYGRNHRAAAEGDAPHGQSNVYTSANPSTRVVDAEGREALIGTSERNVGAEDGLYVRALTCPPIPLSPPEDAESEDGAGDEEIQQQEEELEDEGPVAFPPGVAVLERPGLERVTILTPSSGAVTFVGPEAVAAAKKAARSRGATAASIFSAVRAAVPIQGRTDGKKFQSHRDTLSGGPNQFGLDLEFDGVGTVGPGPPIGLDLEFDGVGTVGPGSPTGLEIDPRSYTRQVLADAFALEERARIAQATGSPKTASALLARAAQLKAQAAAAVDQLAARTIAADKERTR